MKRKEFKDGIYDITNEEYHAAAGFSRSTLMLLNKSPYHFWYEVFSGRAERKEDTPAMITGSLFHTLLLEPHKLDKEYAIAPKIDRRTAKGKEEWAEFQTYSEGKIVVTLDQYEKSQEMANQIREHEIVSTLLGEAVFEQSIFWTDKETGLQFKVRPDIWAAKMVVDVKTSADASYYAFQRSSVGYGYFLQAGMIFEACKAVGKPFEMFVNLVCEKEPPYVPAVYMMDEEALQFGIDQFNNLKKNLRECLDKDEWPAYPVRELGVPMYALKNIDEE